MVTEFEPGTIQSDKSDDDQMQLQNIIGLGKFSVRKSYYPELQKKIAELEEEKNKYERIFSGALNGIFQAELTGRMIVANPAMSRLCGHAWPHQFISITDIGAELFADPAEKNRLITTLLAEKSVIGFETAFKKIDGAIIDVSLNASIRVSADGRQYLEAFVQDITERKRTEEERLKLKKLESVGILAGGIAHDFNNLLTSLFGNIELAKMFLPDDHKSHQFLDFAMGSLDNAVGLTKQLLTFAKGGDPIKETLCIGDLILETARFSLRGSHVKLESNIAADLWPVDADKGQLSQVISNLVINAQQAMPTGGAITLTAENVKTAPGRYVKIIVRDQGMGIAPQYLDKIFDPYFTTKQHGSGLGLASVHSIISKHNGRIEVDSQLNKGTVFTIYLPATGETEEITAPAPPDRTVVPPVTSASILVLDDQNMIRDMLGKMLEKMGYQVAFAVDGQEAIAKYAEAFQTTSPFDLVIADLTIPGGMGGKEAAREILKLDPQAKIIVSSGYATDTVMANYASYGLKGVVVKPYRFPALQSVVQRVLAEQRAG